MNQIIISTYLVVDGIQVVIKSCSTNDTRAKPVLGIFGDHDQKQKKSSPLSSLIFEKKAACQGVFSYQEKNISTRYLNNFICLRLKYFKVRSTKKGTL